MATPHNILSSIFICLILFLIWFKDGLTSVEHFVAPLKNFRVKVIWKDIMSGKLNVPSPKIHWSWDCVCVSPPPPPVLERWCKNVYKRLTQPMEDGRRVAKVSAEVYTWRKGNTQGDRVVKSWRTESAYQQWLRQNNSNRPRGKSCWNLKGRVWLQNGCICGVVSVEKASVTAAERY